MGRKAEFSDQQIIDVGLALEQKGESVSPFAIRNRLNGGSSVRIKQVWDTFIQDRLSRSPDESDQVEVDLPAEIMETLGRNIDTATKQLQKLAAESYKTAQEVAEKRVKSTIDEYKAKVTVLEEAENQATLALESSDKKIDELESQIEELLTKNEFLVSENARISGMLDSYKVRIDQLELIDKSYNELLREYGKLEGRLEALKIKPNERIEESNQNLA
ncbi:DNA-binding protein [Alishewanella sp. HL-SH05]|uniref:DNA-binding protein n=1 Tax=Alishewanella sp. HL-SH05 TaxID=3461145 RepID=UPI0040416F69